MTDATGSYRDGLKYWWSDDEEIIRSEAFDTKEQAYSDAYCYRADCFDNPEADAGFYLHHGKMVDNPDFDEEAYKHYGFDESNFPQLFEGKTDRVPADEVNDFFHDEWVKLSKNNICALPDKPMTEDELLKIILLAINGKGGGIHGTHHAKIAIRALKAANVLYVEEK